MKPAATPCPSCPICGHASVHAVFAIPDNRHECRCSSCGVFFYWPLPSPQELKAFYDAQWADAASEYQSHYGDSVYEEANLKNSFLPRLALLEQKGFHGRILDVGCSVGTFLRAAKQRGWETQGIDLGEAACARTADAVGCPVHCETIESLSLPESDFDVIHASQVVEHVLDPAAFLQAARRLLKPGGALLIAAPIIPPGIYYATNAIQQKLIPFISRGRISPYPWAIHYPFHVFAHSPRSFRLLVETHGFRIAHTRTVPWMLFSGMNAKWRVYYHAMNVLFRLFNTGMNMDILAIR